jgi:hypothetical protein
MILYIWGSKTPATHRIGNATRIVDVEYHDFANDTPKNAGFDVALLNKIGTPTWVTAYATADDEAFEPGTDAALFSGYIEATAEADEF